MQELPRRTGASGPKLIRLLARLTEADIPASRQSPSDRLSQWLGWTDAIALSGALKRVPQAALALPNACSAEEREYARVRAVLENAIAGTNTPAAARLRARPPSRMQDPVKPLPPMEFATYRQRYLSHQQTMDMSIGALRARVRAALAAATPEMKQLALVDAVMEQTLVARERSLLAGVPALLEGHFSRLRQAEQAAWRPASEGSAVMSITPGAWLDVFRKDMQSVLLAELDIRLQPTEGLLAALRAC